MDVVFACVFTCMLLMQTRLVCVYLCVCECVLELFLETAAVESIIRYASTDIPRMPSGVSDPSGETIAETKEIDTHTRGSGIPPSFPKGQLHSVGTHSAVTQSSRGHLFL